MLNCKRNRVLVLYLHDTPLPRILFAASCRSRVRARTNDHLQIGHPNLFATIAHSIAARNANQVVPADEHPELFAHFL